MRLTDFAAIVSPNFHTGMPENHHRGRVAVRTSQDGGLAMSFPALKIGNLTARIPVIQGGMGVGISLSGLASAVANQGGIGVIAGAMIGMK